jgi:hypothetical protein
MKDLIKLSLLFSLLIHSINMNSQVTIQTGSFSPFSISPDQLLNSTVSNVSGQSQNGIITTTLYSSDRRVMCVVTSSIFEIPTGITQLNGKSIIQEYSYSELPIAQYLYSTGRLLAGNYEVCSELEYTNSELPAESCTPILSDYSSFLQLQFPMDGSSIEEPNPILTWIHSGILPTTNFRETFELLLVEKGTDQSAIQALNENALHLYITNLNTHALLYPINSKPLETGKQYAWQVLHKFDGILLESSESWWFEYKEYEDPRDIKYVDITDGNPKESIDVYHSLYVRFDEAYNSSVLNIELIDETGKRIAPNVENDMTTSSAMKKNGFNGYKINLSGYQLKAGSYRVRITDSMNKLHTIRINYIK